MPNNRIILLTRDFNRLQTLKVAGFYVLVAISPWANLNRLSAAVVVVAFFSAVVWYWAVKTYYKRSFGQVERSDLQDVKQRRFAFLPTAVIAIGAWAFLLRNEHVPYEWFLMWVPAFAVSEGLFYSQYAIRRTYYLAAAAISLLVLLSAMFAAAPGHGYLSEYYPLFMGSAMLLCCIFDHLLLVRSFRQTAREVSA